MSRRPRELPRHDPPAAKLLVACSICEVQLELVVVAAPAGRSFAALLAARGGPRCPWCTRALDHPRQLGVAREAPGTPPKARTPTPSLPVHRPEGAVERCRECGAVLPVRASPRGRPAVYCGPACRGRAGNRRYHERRRSSALA